MASINMPKPEMAQAINAPNPPVTRPNACGREKMPAPTIEPTTMADNVHKENFCSDDVVMTYSSAYATNPSAARLHNPRQK